ncbi:hypothetical protein C8J55DRAFT_310418 [Lentinula edodes]|uniref:Uncharacterized protein n=1 Tax=Lentinula lateritia TaxID=40482 RepID=A0A9W8ZP19_9AGAR|nr:hypothetical protein C8J55DRAFT_310418 [Lentinula edodes]
MFPLLSSLLSFLVILHSVNTLAHPYISRSGLPWPIIPSIRSSWTCNSYGMRFRLNKGSLSPYNKWYGVLTNHASRFIIPFLQELVHKSRMRTLQAAILIRTGMPENVEQLTDDGLLPPAALSRSQGTTRIWGETCDTVQRIRFHIDAR